ncbi:MAG: hypothetical protein LBS89_07540 [Zoogloeaceae bacterium]|jgi:hypothetical protein|nr:hypothetical protein [Zoogloeaceae bacterium]
MTHPLLPLAALLNLKIVHMDSTAEMTGIRFEQGIHLAIYNRLHWQGIAPDKISLLTGKRIVKLLENEKRIILSFEGGASLEIDMQDAAQTGPEAMQLDIPGQPLVVWN